MPKDESDANVATSEAMPEPALTLEDLLKSESEVLRRVGQEHGTERSMGGHNSGGSQAGHQSGSTHNSHTSARPERPFEN